MQNKGKPRAARRPKPLSKVSSYYVTKEEIQGGSGGFIYMRSKKNLTYLCEQTSGGL